MAGLFDPHRAKIDRDHIERGFRTPVKCGYQPADERIWSMLFHQLGGDAKRAAAG